MAVVNITSSDARGRAWRGSVGKRFRDCGHEAAEPSRPHAGWVSDAPSVVPMATGRAGLTEPYATAAWSFSRSPRRLVPAVPTGHQTCPKHPKITTGMRPKTMATCRRLIKRLPSACGRVRVAAALGGTGTGLVPRATALASQVSRSDSLFVREGSTPRLDNPVPPDGCERRALRAWRA